MRCVGHSACIVYLKGYLARAGTIRVHTAKFAACPKHDRAAIGRPVHVGIDTGYRPGFLHVEIEIAINHLLAAAGDIFHP